MGLRGLILFTVFCLLATVTTTRAFASSLPFTGHHADPYDPTNDLLNAFGKGCQSVGLNTLEALTQASSLIDISRKIENDPACSALNLALTNVVGASAQISSLVSPYEASKEKLRYDQAVTEYLAAYSVTNDPNLQLYLAASIADLKTQAVMLTQESAVQKRQLLYQGLAQFANYNDSLFAALSSNSQCLMKRPGLAAQIAGQAVALGSNFLSFPLSPAAFLAGQAVSNLVGYLQQHRFDKAIRDLVTERLRISAGCAVEALANTFCEARDSDRLIDQYHKFQTVDAPMEWQGFVLLDRDMDAFVNWVQRLSAGSPPSTRALADSKSPGYIIESTYYVTSDKFSAELREADMRLSRIPNPDTNPAAKAVIRTTIERLINVVTFTLMTSDDPSRYISSSSTISQNSPFYQFFAYDYKCGPRTFFFTGDTVPTPATNVTCPVYNDAQVPTISKLKDNVQNLLDSTKSYVTTESHLFRENDAELALASWDQEIGARTSPRVIIDRIITYLTDLQSAYGNRIPMETAALIKDTIERLNKAVLTLTDTNQDKIQRIALGQEALAPQQDAFFMATRLRLILNWELSEKLRDGSLNKDVAMIIQMALHDNVGALEQIVPINLELTKQGPNANAKNLAIQNLAELGRIFGPSLDRGFKKLLEEKSRLKSPTADQALDLLCIQSLALPFENRDLKLDLTKYCRGRKLSATGFDRPVEVSFDEAARAPFEERVCRYYDYRRLSTVLSYKKTFARAARIPGRRN